MAMQSLDSKDTSLETSLTGSLSADSSVKEKNSTSNCTTTSFDNSNLDLTVANCYNITQQRKSSRLEGTSFSQIPVLNLSSGDDEQTKHQQNGYKSNCELETSLQISNEMSPISNYNKALAGELSPVNRAIFSSVESLPPTQPSSVIILQGVTAYVDVRSGAENRSLAFKEVLQSLGAETVEKFTFDVTHLIFRDGSKSNYQKALQRGVCVVSPLWVDACRIKLVRVSEDLFPISHEFSKQNVITGKIVFPRKLKSMQPRNIEDDIQLAEAKMKKKKRLQSCTSSNSEEVFTPPSKVSSHSEDINSPLFGISHLVTPLRKSTRDDSSTQSSEKSSDEKEFRTPLAVRMYNKFLSPLPNSMSSPQGHKILCTPLSKNDGRTSENEDSSAVCHDAETPSPSLGRIKKKISQHLKNCEDKNSKNKDCVSNDNSDSASGIQKEYQSTSASCERSFDPSSEHDENELFVESKRRRRKVILPTTNTNVRRSTRLSDKGKGIKNQSSDESSKNKSDEESSKTSEEESLKERRVSTSTTSLPTNSSFPAVSVKRRRLHTVDILPSQELIVPSTPPLQERNRNPLPYESLRSDNTLSQREEMKVLNRKLKGDFKVLPLPRSAKQNDKQRNLFETNKKTNSFETSLSPLEENSVNSAMMTPKSRFSLIPRERNSSEEFQSSRNGRRRKNRSSRFSRQLSLPSICVSSVHSSNIGSLYAIIKSLGGFQITRDVDTTTTHVICGAERRTVNVLRGISQGCWILDVSWLYESVEMLEWAPEEPFEMFNFCPGAKISRLLRVDKSEAFQPSLFAKLGRIYVSSSCTPSPLTIQELLSNCGSHIASTVRSADLIVGTEKIDAVATQVSVNWIFDSVQGWELKNIEDYQLK